MAAPLLLAYNIDSQRKLVLRYICAGLKIHILYVPATDYRQPLAALAGLRPRAEAASQAVAAPLAEAASPAEAASGDEVFRDEMLVMANFTKPLFNAFLDALRRNRVQGIALKAVLTPTNAEWDSVKLHEELLREHEAMHGRS